MQGSARHGSGWFAASLIACVITVACGRTESSGGAPYTDDADGGSRSVAATGSDSAPVPPAPDQQRWAVFAPLDGLSVIDFTDLRAPIVVPLAQANRTVRGLSISQDSRKLAFLIEEQAAFIPGPSDGANSGWPAEHSLWVADSRDGFVPRRLALDEDYATIGAVAWVGSHALIARVADTRRAYWVWIDAETGATRDYHPTSPGSNVWPRERGAVVELSSCHLQYWARDTQAVATLHLTDCDDDYEPKVHWAPDEGHFAVAGRSVVDVYAASGLGATALELGLPLGPEDATYTGLEWAPDSRQFVHFHQRDNFTGDSLVVVDLNAQLFAEHRTPAGVSYARMPAPDTLVVDDWESGTVWLASLNAANGIDYREVPLQDSGQFFRIVSTDGRTMYYDLHADAVAGVYSLDLSTGEVSRRTPAIEQGQTLEYFDLLPNENWLYYRVTDSRFLLDLRNGSQIELPTLSGVEPGESISLYRVPDQQLALFHSVRSRDGRHIVYWLSLDTPSAAVPLLEFTSAHRTNYLTFPTAWHPIGAVPGHR